MRCATGWQTDGVFKGFRDFVVRGNVIDLAVGVVIGAAFNALVMQFTASFLQPVIRRMGGGSGEVAGKVRLGGGQFIDWGAFVNAVISLLLTAAVLYFLVVVPMNRLAQRHKNQPAKEVPLKDDIRLLTEIRDALRRLESVPGQRRPADDAVEGASDAAGTAD
jgi:large conductance mechanosensitive channel